MTALPAGHRAALPTGPGEATLADEHASLLWQVCARAEVVLDALPEGWPPAGLAALVDYLRFEVLEQASDEEREVFPAAAAPEGTDRLYRDHSRLRAAVEVLAGFLRRPGEAALLAATVRGLVVQLEAHLRTEEALLPQARGTRRELDAYPLTEEQVVDLDLLPARTCTAAALHRVGRLRPGEAVLLRSSTDPLPLWRCLSWRSPGAYGWAYLHEGLPCWEVRVTHRVPA